MARRIRPMLIITANIYFASDGTSFSSLLPARWGVLLTPLNRWGNWGLETLRCLYRLTLPVSIRDGFAATVATVRQSKPWLSFFCRISSWDLIEPTFNPVMRHLESLDLPGWCCSHCSWLRGGPLSPELLEGNDCLSPLVFWAGQHWCQWYSAVLSAEEESSVSPGSYAGQVLTTSLSSVVGLSFFLWSPSFIIQ